MAEPPLDPPARPPIGCEDCREREADVNGCGGVPLCDECAAARFVCVHCGRPGAEERPVACDQWGRLPMILEVVR